MTKKVFISADIEGVDNVLTWDETELGESKYPRYRKFMTQEVKAACDQPFLTAEKKSYIIGDLHIIASLFSGQTDLVDKSGHRNLPLSDQNLSKIGRISLNLYKFVINSPTSDQKKSNLLILTEAFL